MVLLINPWDPEGYCSCLVQIGCGRSQLLGTSFINVWCHYAPKGKLYNLNMQIVSPFPQLKVRRTLSDICCAAHTFCHTKNLCSLQLLILYINYSLKGTLPLFPLVSLANEMCELFLHHFTQKLGRFCNLPVHFVIGRICIHSNCSVHHLFVPSTLLFCFP